VNENSNQKMARLALRIKEWGLDLGFQQVGITDTDLSEAEAHLQN
jgi:epoxyqueuosine reductase